MPMVSWIGFRVVPRNDKLARLLGRLAFPSVCGRAVSLGYLGDRQRSAKLARRCSGWMQPDGGAEDRYPTSDAPRQGPFGGVGARFQEPLAGVVAVTAEDSRSGS